MTTNLEISFALDTAVATDTETRSFTAIAVPYDKPTQREPFYQFSAGAFGDVTKLPNVLIYSEHPTQTGEAIRIGRVTGWEDTETGLQFSADLFDDESASAVYASLKSGDLNSVSITVLPMAFSGPDDLTVSSAEVMEISVVANPRYAEAKVLLVNSDEQPETPINNIEGSTSMENTQEVAELRGEVEELTRSLAVFAESNRPTTPAVSQFKSFGEVVKAVVAGDADAIAELNEFAYTGPVSGDVNKAHVWATPLLNVVNLGRPIASLFNKQPDPKTNNIDYLKINTDTIAVAEQTVEGQDLAYGKIDLTSASASLKTYGGWFDFSQQSLDRADVNVVDLGYRALAARYAAVTETVVRTTFLAASGTTAVSGFNPATYSTVIDTVVDAQTIFNNRGQSIEFIVASPDVFKTLAKANTGTANDFVLNRDNGSVSVTGISATLFGIPVKVLPSGTDVFTFTNSSALTIWESGVGKLTDSNIVNLTSAFSLYGYMGVAVTDASAIVKAVA